MTSTVKVNNVQASDGGNIINQCGTTITLGASGDTIALASGASQTGFGRTGTVDWQTSSIKTATFTAANGEGYFCNTAGGAFEVDLPAGSAGAIVSIQDYNNSFNSNNLTVDPNGSEIINGGSAGDPVILNTAAQGVTFVYVDSTVGWRSVQDNTYAAAGSSFITATGGTITTCGDDRIHKFTGPGTFCVTGTAACAADNVISYLVVAGGGGAKGDYGGGAGAGGYREVKSPSTPYTASPLDGYPSSPNRVTVTTQAYPITVGAGGSAPCTGSAQGCNGSNSVFSTITSAGGGGGGAGSSPSPAPEGSGKDGGSGGGAGGYGPGTRPGGTGNTPSVTPAQGTNGGATTSPGAGYSSAGGGGATAAGTASTNPGSPGPNGGPGGAGATTNITGSPVIYAGGGGGGSWDGSGSTGGPGGGGNGGRNSGAPNATNGTANTGGGGGGGGGSTPNSTQTGGSGIVVIRYKYQ